MDAVIIGAHSIGARVGFVPLNDHDCVPRSATDADLREVKPNVRQEPLQPFVPLPGRQERSPRTAQRMVAEKRMFKSARELPQHGFGVALVYRVEQLSNSAADDRVVHFRLL